MGKCRIFVSSSSRSLTLAEVLVDQLNTNFSEAELWKEELRRRPGRTTIEVLDTATNKYDFAVIIFSKDDVIDAGTGEMLKARDNCVFEAGLFIKALGRERCILIVGEGTDVRTDLPADLVGINALRYRESEQLRTREACQQVIKERHIVSDIKDIVERYGKFSDKFLSDEELLERETLKAEGGYLLGDQIVVVSSQPFESFSYDAAVRAWKNMRNGVSYVYFLKGDMDGAKKVCELLQVTLLASVLSEDQAKSKYARDTEIRKNEVQQKVVENLKIVCEKDSLRIHFVQEKPNLQYVIHNAQSETAAILYFRHGDGFWKWQQGPDAHTFWTVERDRLGLGMTDRSPSIKLNSRKLADFLATIPDETTISMTRGDQRLLVKSDQHQIHLPILPPEPTPVSAIFQGAAGIDVREEPFHTILTNEFKKAFPGICDQVIDACVYGKIV